MGLTHFEWWKLPSEQLGRDNPCELAQCEMYFMSRLVRAHTPFGSSNPSEAALRCSNRNLRKLVTRNHLMIMVLLLVCMVCSLAPDCALTVGFIHLQKLAPSLPWVAPEGLCAVPA